MQLTATLLPKLTVQKPSLVKDVENMQPAHGMEENVSNSQDAHHMQSPQIVNARPFQIDASQMELTAWKLIPVVHTLSNYLV